MRALLPPLTIALILLSLSSTSDINISRTDHLTHLNLSTSLVSRTLWKDDEQCRRFNISYLVPK